MKRGGWEETDLDVRKVTTSLLSPEARSGVKVNRFGVKKAEHQRIDAFELWYWKRLWRVPWTARRSNQSILKDKELDRTD